MLVQRSNAGRIFVQTFVEFRRPRCSGGGLGQASVVDNGRAIHTSDLLNKQVKFSCLSYQVTYQVRPHLFQENQELVRP